jgi:hypothetical protein
VDDALSIDLAFSRCLKPRNGWNKKLHAVIQPIVVSRNGGQEHREVSVDRAARRRKRAVLFTLSSSQTDQSLSMYLVCLSSRDNTAIVASRAVPCDTKRDEGVPFNVVAVPTQYEA